MVFLRWPHIVKLNRHSLVRFLAGVDAFVLLDVTELGELSLAVPTDVGLDPAVDAPMLGQVGAGRELTSTLVAPVRTRVLLVRGRVVVGQVLS